MTLTADHQKILLMISNELEQIIHTRAPQDQVVDAALQDRQWLVVEALHHARLMIASLTCNDRKEGEPDLIRPRAIEESYDVYMKTRVNEDIRAPLLALYQKNAEALQLELAAKEQLDDHLFKLLMILCEYWPLNSRDHTEGQDIHAKKQPQCNIFFIPITDDNRAYTVSGHLAARKEFLEQNRSEGLDAKQEALPGEKLIHPFLQGQFLDKREVRLNLVLALTAEKYKEWRLQHPDIHLDENRHGMSPRTFKRLLVVIVYALTEAVIEPLFADNEDTRHMPIGMHFLISLVLPMVVLLLILGINNLFKNISEPCLGENEGPLGWIFDQLNQRVTQYRVKNAIKAEIDNQVPEEIEQARSIFRLFTPLNMQLPAPAEVKSADQNPANIFPAVMIDIHELEPEKKSIPNLQLANQREAQHRWLAMLLSEIYDYHG